MSALTFCYAIVPGVCRRTGQRVLSTLAGETSGFHIVAHEFGHSGRPLPTWTCSRPGNVKFDDDAMVVTTHRDLSLFVPGCFQLLNVLTPGECDQLTNITTCMGWDEDAPELNQPIYLPKLSEVANWNGYTQGSNVPHHLPPPSSQSPRLLLTQKDYHQF